MQTNHQAYKLPFQTKIVFGFILFLTIVLIAKWAYYSVINPPKVSQIEEKFSGITTQVNEVCMREEKKNLKGSSEATEDDQDWINFKAPEYCKCVSTHLIASWNEQKRLEQIHEINDQRRPGYIVAQLKSDDTKETIDFCLSRAQKISGKKMTASAAKN